ncbi:MAG: hypothetical protein HWN66_11680 [Candidatus Helarchaeota archaeon]|nr:hypothetical protein [Candidatus Helarchaeota archaeon]
MEFIKNEIVFEKPPNKLVNLLIDVIHRKDESLDEIINHIDKENLYAEISGKGRINYINIGFFENYERNNTTELVAFCPQIKIKHKVKEKEITVYLYKESHSLLLKKEQFLRKENKLVGFTRLELRYILAEATKLGSLIK